MELNTTSKMKHLTIGLAGLFNHQNYGDGVIGDCTEWLLRNADNNIDIVKIDMTGISHFIPFRVFHKIFHTFAITNKWVSQILVFLSKYFFHAQGIKCDAIVFSGGSLIEYSQFFMFAICGIIRIAEGNNIPVFLNAVGIEGQSDTDIRCKILKKHLNSMAVKMITIRDDIETLQEKFLNQQTPIVYKKVADPAVFTSTVYNQSRERNTKVIGIGLIHGNIFLNHGGTVSSLQLLELYTGIIRELENREMPYKLFTNGVPIDNYFAYELARYTQKDYLIQEMIIPKDASELVQCISSFRGIIAGRLHANIIAYSLDIPSVGIVWSKKLSIWGANIGYPERFIPSEHLSAVYMIEKLEKALTEGYDETRRRSFMNTETDAIRELFTMIRNGVIA